MFSIADILSPDRRTPKRKRDELKNNNENLNRTFDKKARLDSAYDDYNRDDSKSAYYFKTNIMNNINYYLIIRFGFSGAWLVL